MPITEKLELLIRDLEFAGVAQGIGPAAILLGDDEHLEAFPAHGPDGLDGGVHVLVEIIAVDHRVDLEHDAVLLAQDRQLPEFLQMVPLAAADLDVGGFVEGVARHGHDVDVTRVLLQPLGGDFAAVGDDRDGFKPKGFFAVFGELAQESRVHEWLAAGEVDLFHSRTLEKRHCFLGVFQRLHV